MSLIRNCFETLISLIFPRRCPVCDKPVRPFGELVCDECQKNIRYVHGATCYKCGKPLGDENAEYCLDCRTHKHLYISGMSLFEYKSISDSIYRYKYKGRQEYAEWYGEQMSLFWGERMLKLKPDALVPVPIHASKMKKRGYNQASLLAYSISKRLGIPVYDNIVCRVKKTIPLKDLAPNERNNILRGAFKLSSDVVKLKTIVIIDDIYTTGATVDAVATPLLNAGVENIYYVSLAIGRGV